MKAESTIKLKVSKLTHGADTVTGKDIIIDIGIYNIIREYPNVLYIYVPDDECIAIVDYDRDIMKIKRD